MLSRQHAAPAAPALATRTRIQPSLAGLDAVRCCASVNGKVQQVKHAEGAEQQQQKKERDEVQQLRQSVADLLGTVQEQQQMLLQQQEQLQQLRDTLSQLQQQPAPAGTSSSSAGPPASPMALSSWDSYQDSGSSGTSPGGVGDLRVSGGFDARWHSTSTSATPPNSRVLPARIILVRHAQSLGNVNSATYTFVPDPQVPLSQLGHCQALEAGEAIRAHMEAASGGEPYTLFFYASPYKRSLQTCEGIKNAFAPAQVAGVQEEVQLREQDFGNFQDAEGKEREKAERLRFGRFFYRFPNGESGADVYDRITVFTDHLIRDINAGRFANNTSLVLVTHGLALRIFLMRWFHWSVDQFMGVYNPPNAAPLVLERLAWAGERPPDSVHTKSLYRLSPDSSSVLQGLTPDMCQTSARPPGCTWSAAASSSSSSSGDERAAAGSLLGPAALFVSDDLGVSAGTAAEQWAELGGGW